MKPSSLLLTLLFVLQPACGPPTVQSVKQAHMSRKHTAARAVDVVANQELKREYHALALRNLCPDGPDAMQGRWRFIGSTKNVGFDERLVVEGTRYTDIMTGTGDDGRPMTATIQGEVRCVYKNRVLVMLDVVEPAGAFGNQPGDTYPCDILGAMDMSADRFLMICYFDWDLRTSAGMEFEYSRVE